ncbi:MAG TPA: peptide chain release factor N(5)-glutamine methyltransferase [Clostridiales bacterium]|nr:peptide chain release factor N(5)-glutamine methyltransferase [Clostridiales bacterium]
MVEPFDIRTIGELYTCIKNGLKARVESYDYESRLLLSYVLGEDPYVVYLHPERSVEEDRVSLALKMAKKRSEGVPLQYLIKTAYFMGYDFEVNENVLIPRPDTEVLVQKALEYMDENYHVHVLDMGTGSGCIAISLALLNRCCTVDAVDISQSALKVAKKNALRHRVEHQIQFIHSDLFSNLSDSYHMIVSNPPYIKHEEYEFLQEEVRCFEPVQALVANEEGLAFYKRIAGDARQFLKAGGSLLFETGYDQAAHVVSIMKENGFTGLEVTKDYNGINRVVSGIIK